MDQEKGFFVVGIGASAGGLDAVQQFFDFMPSNTGIAFVIIQHLSPDFKSLMPELLAKHTKMEIYTAKNNQKLKPNCIYLNQRSKNIGIKDNHFVLLDKAPKDHLNLPIDILFHMLGETFKDRSIGVILSGTGSDGSRGIKTIKEAGGTILVQEPESAQFNGMPNSAILTNLADFILTPDALAEKIVQFTHKRLNIDAVQNNSQKNEESFKRILEIIQKHTGVNFKNYKINTLLRRIEKRLSLHNIESLDGYLNYLEKDDKEKDAIFQEFLIGVTSFFRDKEAFETLASVVIPEICNNKDTKNNIRIWIPGCSSGEEVYSIAILFEEYIRKNKLGTNYKIFATDIDKKALYHANMGNYPVNNCAEINRNFLEEYFIKSGEKIQIVKRIREKIVFSYHDVTKDPPFIKVDFISCRNLLIYFSAKTQKSVLAGFQFALNKNGFLFLGGSESLGAIGSSFKVINPKFKLFQNINDNKRINREDTGAPNFYYGSTRISSGITSKQQSLQAPNPQKELFYFKYLSQKHAPVTVFIDKDFTIHFMQGNFNKWFKQNDGIFTNNLLNLVSPELSAIIRNGIRRLKEHQLPIKINNVLYNNGNDEFSTDLYFENVVDGFLDLKLFLVQFDVNTNISKVKSDAILLSDKEVSSLSKHRIKDLELELKETKTELQNVVEELETSNEELQSSNEELMSSNEELQSSNEELQSVNEELYTVNTEFQEKNKELENLNNDVNNLLNSTEIGTLFLDTKLNIRKFTPAIKRIFKLEETDIGRSISSFASEFDDEIRKIIISDSKLALEKLRTFNKEIKDNNNDWYLMRIGPFITNNKKIDGVVITFVDISSMKKAKQDLDITEDRLNRALEAGNMAWWEMELPSGTTRFKDTKATMLGYKPNDFATYKDFMKIVHPDDYDSTMEAMKNHLAGKTERYFCQYRIKNANNEYVWFQDIGKIVYNNETKTILSGIVIDISDKKETDLQLIVALKKAETANIYKNQFLANMSHEIRTPMNGLVGFANLLRDENLDTNTKNNYIDIIENSSKHLLNLINDIIDVSKIEAGELRIEFTSCNLNQLFKELETTFNEIKYQNNKNKIEIIADIPEEQDAIIIETDPYRLKQILSNLIGNALKFTDEGEIRFSFSIKGKKVIFKVSDTGIGIDSSKKELIFQRFQQLQNPQKSIRGGTGLGLSIIKGLLSLLNGKIDVQSKVGTGSLFTFEIPYKPASENIKEHTTSNNIDLNRFANKKILVAEDDQINKIYLQEVFKSLPSEIIWANNGKEAIELYKRHKDVSLILLDIQMPYMDGFSVAKEILEQKPETKIIAQTAYAMESDKNRCLEHGFIDYIAKPIKQQKLIQMMAKWLQ